MTHGIDDMLSMLQKYLIYNLKKHFTDVSFLDENPIKNSTKLIFKKERK